MIGVRKAKISRIRELLNDRKERNIGIDPRLLRKPPTAALKPHGP